MRWLLILVLVGCGDAGGPDLDGDGITDGDDDCQAGPADEAADADGDGKDATEDLCPHDTNAVAGDLDFDGIPDACDPFFPVTTPDTRRCVTSFAVRWMNASYFVARPGEELWDLTPSTTDSVPDGLTARTTEIVSMVSTFGFGYRSVTFDILGSMHFRAAADSSNFKVWLRASGAPSNKDIACGLDGLGNMFVWADNGRHSIVSLPIAIDGPFRLRATVQGGGSSGVVLCRATVADKSIATTYATALEVGTWGFASAMTDVKIDSTVIDSRDDAPPI